MGLGTLGVGEGDALRDQAARTRGCSGGDKIGGAFNAQARVARQHLVAAAGFEEAGKVGQLMDDDFRLRPDNGVAQGLAVEHIRDDRRHAVGSQLRLLRARARRAGDGMPVGEQEKRQSPSDSAGGAGEKNVHRDRSFSPPIAARSNLIVSTSRIAGSPASATGRKAKRASPVRSQAAPLSTETTSALV
jgi:hypothetical protein